MGWVNNNVIQPVAKAATTVASAPVNVVSSTASTALGATSNVVSGVGNVLGNAGKAVVALPGGALRAAGSAVGDTAGSVIQGVLGPGGSNAPALGALVGGALGNPMALQGLGSSAPVSEPQTSLIQTPSVGPSVLSQDSGMSIYLIGGLAVLGLLLLKGRR